MTLEQTVVCLAGRKSSVREYVTSDLHISYSHFRRVVTGDRATPSSLLRRIDQVAKSKGLRLSLEVPELPSPLQIGLPEPQANPSLN